MKRPFILLTSLLVLSCNQNTKTNQNENLETESNTKTKTEMTENLDWLTGNWKRLNEEAVEKTFIELKEIDGFAGAIAIDKAGNIYHKDSYPTMVFTSFDGEYFQIFG